MITSNPNVLFQTLHTNTLCNIFLPAILLASLNCRLYWHL